MRIKRMTRCALFAALLAVCSWLSVPFGDGAVTMQTLGIFVTLGLLGGYTGSGSIFIYLCLGAIGLPVFSGFQGGFGVLLGPTGGFLWGFLVAGGVFCWLEKRLPLWLNLILCQLTISFCGFLWYSLSYAAHGAWLTVLVYLLPDTLKLLLAWMLVRKIKPYLT